MAILRILVLVLFVNNVVAQSNNCTRDHLGQLYGISDSLLAIWRNDKDGCQQKRILLIDSLFKPKALIGMPKKVFIQMFGIPDQISPKKNFTYHNYNYCTPPTKE